MQPKTRQILIIACASAAMVIVIVVATDQCTYLTFFNLELTKGCEQKQENPPTVNISAQIKGFVGETITFDSTGTFKGDADIVRYLWKFETEGISKEESSVTYVFKTPGTKIVTLTVTDENEMKGDATHSIEITTRDIVDKQPPKFSQTRDLNFMVPNDSGAIINYDLPTVTDDVGVVRGPDCKPESGKKFPIGMTTVTCEAFDSADNKGITSFKVTVMQEHTTIHPTAIISGPSSGTVDETMTFSASSSFDPDGSIVSYQWSFGDGTSSSGSTVTHTYSSEGVKTVKLTIVDNDNLESTVLHTITIESLPPQYTVTDSCDLIIKGTWSVDFETCSLSSTNQDLFWQQSTATERYLVPRNGAQIVNLGVVDIDSINDPTQYSYSSNNVDGSTTSNTIPSGTVLLIHTGEGNYVKMRIDDYGYNLSVTIQMMALV